MPQENTTWSTTYDAAIAKTERKLDRLLAKRDVELSETRVKCESSVLGRGCGKRFPINTLTYIQTLYWCPPYGCTGGGYHANGEGQFDCPACGNRNRLYNRPEIQELKHLFKDTVKVTEAA